MGPQMILILLLAASGPVTYGYMKVHEAIVVSAAVKAERRQGVVACNVRVGEIERKHNEGVDQAADDAIAAADQIERTPDEMEALKALCKRSASCRSRGKL